MKNQQLTPSHQIDQPRIDKMPPIRSDLKVSVSASVKSEKSKKSLSPLSTTQLAPLDVTPPDPAACPIVSTPNIQHANAVDEIAPSLPCATDHIAHPREFRTKQCIACSEIFTPNNGRQLLCHNCSPNLKQPSKRLHSDPFSENENKRHVVEKEVTIDDNA